MDDPNAKAKRKTALVLSGGGAYGAYEVGVVKALCHGESPSVNGVPLDADVFTGTSVGSFNAAVMATDLGEPAAVAAELERVWLEEVADKGDGRGNGVFRIRGYPPDYLELSPERFFTQTLPMALGDAAQLGTGTASRFLDFFHSQGGLVPRSMALVDISALFDIEKFRELVARNVDTVAIRNSVKTLEVAATNWEDGKVEPFVMKQKSDEDMRQAILASAAIPGLFPPVFIGTKLYVDGGVVMNTPISFAVNTGATELHVINLDPEVPTVSADKIRNTMDTFGRVFTSMLAGKIEEDVETARWINTGIEVLEKAGEGSDGDLTTDDGRRLMRVAGQFYERLKKGGAMYEKLTIHRYYPRTASQGLLGMLDFSAAAIERLIDQGYRETREHCCKCNHCVIPGEPEDASPHPHG